MSRVDPVFLYDTTLRDGSQSEGVHFSVDDKVRIAHRLDALGVDFIEGGWPGANPTDELFFQRMRETSLQNSRLAAFGSTRRSGVAVDKDRVMAGLLRAGTGVVTVFGKSWLLHVSHALGVEPSENLDLISDSIHFLKQRVDTVFFDAEHFFDGYKDDAEYALKVLDRAREAGAACLVLCDTNGGCLPSEVGRITGAVAVGLPGVPLGIHCHNDSATAVASTLAALDAGASQAQGTINGLGERCGNADLVAVIANLVLKTDRKTAISKGRLAKLSGVSRFVDEMINRMPRREQPFVGHSAFAHKGGIHVSAILKKSATYEHILPEAVGNVQRVLVSGQSGRSTLRCKFSEFGMSNLDADDARLSGLLKEIKDLEHQGYAFEGAEASVELRARQALGEVPEYFKLQGFRVIDERRFREGDRLMGAEATVRLQLGQRQVYMVGEGDGPFDALNVALCRALEWDYPSIKDVKLRDYKVRILNGGGTGARVRVLIEWGDGKRTWWTVGVSDHIIAASYDAMVEAFIFKLFKDGVPAQS